MSEPIILAEWLGRPRTERDGNPYRILYRVVEVAGKRWIESAVEYPGDTPAALVWERDGGQEEADWELSKRLLKRKSSTAKAGEAQSSLFGGGAG